MEQTKKKRSEYTTSFERGEEEWERKKHGKRARKKVSHTIATTTKTTATTPEKKESSVSICLWLSKIGIN